MGRPYVHVHLHFVWATWKRMAWLTPPVERRVHATVNDMTVRLGATPLAIGGTDDHVHLFARMPARVAPSVLVGEVKGASSHLMNNVIRPDDAFCWRASYGVVSVDSRTIDIVRNYVLHQREHHDADDLIALLERDQDEDY